MKKSLLVLFILISDYSFAQLSTNALHIIGTGADAVQIQNSPTYSFSDFTIEAWIRDEASPLISSDESIFSYAPNTFTTNVLDLSIHNGHPSFTIGSDMNNTHNLTLSSLSLKDNTCHHVAVVRQSGNLTMYVDGVFYNPSVYDASTLQFLYSYSIYIGVFSPNTFPQDWFKGLIKEVRLWNEARTGSEIQNNMNSVLNYSASGLICYWRCNEGSGQVITDYAHGYNGLASAPVWTTGCPPFCTYPTASITAGGSTTFCSGDSVILNANTGTGLSYEWKLNGGTVQGATSSFYSATASGSYTCIVTNSCGNTTSNNINVTTDSNPPAPTITPSGNTTFCFGGSVTLTSDAASGYHWSNGATTQVILVSTGGTFVVAVANAAGCLSSSAPLVITVNTSPSTPSRISGNNHPSANASGVPFSILPVPGATSYTWTVSPAITIAGGQGTNSITTNFASNFTNGIISVVANNSCGTSHRRNKAVRNIIINCPESQLPAPISLLDELRVGHETDDEENIFDVEVYPNPSTDHFTLKIISPADSKCLLVIKNVLGKEMERREIISTEEQIDFGFHLANGIYFAELIQDDFRKVLRLIKSK